MKTYPEPECSICGTHRIPSSKLGWRVLPNPDYVGEPDTNATIVEYDWLCRRCAFPGEDIKTFRKPDSDEQIPLL